MRREEGFRGCGAVEKEKRGHLLIFENLEPRGADGAAPPPGAEPRSTESPARQQIFLHGIRGLACAHFGAPRSTGVGA